MKRKMAISFVIMALVCALVGGATFAMFTSSATNSNNTFSAGKLKVTAGEQAYGTFDITNIAPGDKIAGSFTVTNPSTDSTLDEWIKITPTKTGTLFEGDYAATIDNITVSGPSGTTITTYSGTSGATYYMLPVGSTYTVSYEVNWTIDAPNAYQNAPGTVTFAVDSAQYRNNPSPSF